MNAIFFLSHIIISTELVYVFFAEIAQKLLLSFFCNSRCSHGDNKNWELMPEADNKKSMFSYCIINGCQELINSSAVRVKEKTPGARFIDARYVSRSCGDGEHYPVFPR